MGNLSDTLPWLRYPCLIAGLATIVAIINKNILYAIFEFTWLENIKGLTTAIVLITNIIASLPIVVITFKTGAGALFALLISGLFAPLLNLYYGYTLLQGDDQ